MKPSGVAWLGDIPADWQLKHTKYLFTPSKERVGEKAGDYKLLSLTLRGIIPRSEVEGGKNPEKYDTYQIVNNNDLVMCLFDYDVTPRTVGRATQAGMVTGAYTVLKAQKNVSTRYYNYLFLSLDESKELLHLCTGLRNGISKSTFFTLDLPNPDYETQERVADYLDKETAQIDKLIAKQQHLLKLLEEKRRGTITTAVIRGIGPDVELHESGNIWIRYIPSGWSVSKLKHFTSLITDGTHTTPTYVEEGVPFLSIKDVSSGKIDFTNCKYISEEEHQVLTKHTRIEKGDILFTRIGTLGVNVIIDTDEVFDIFVSLGLLKVIPGSINKNYLVYCMSSGYYFEYIQQVKAGGDTAAAKFNLGDVANSPITVPPVDEQNEIVEYLNAELAEIDKLKDKICAQIDLLQERRVSLISHLVTGKVKV